MELVFALSVFVVAHVLTARPALKSRLIARGGQRAYLLGYTLLSLALFAWVISVLLRAPRVHLWATPSWAYAFALGLSLLAFLLMGIGAATPNPFSISIRAAAYDPAHPGVVGWLRHPILWGLGAWGLAHVPANGDWPSLVLFLGASTFAVLGVFTVQRRRHRMLGAEAFARLWPSAGHWDRRATMGALLGGAIWGVLLALHPTLFGVSPLSAFIAVWS